MVRLKVDKDGRAKISVYKFQFLMVRLKEYLITLIQCSLQISIPYGAIKSL